MKLIWIGRSQIAELFAIAIVDEVNLDQAIAFLKKNYAGYPYSKTYFSQKENLD